MSRLLYLRTEPLLPLTVMSDEEPEKCWQCEQDIPHDAPFVLLENGYHLCNLCRLLRQDLCLCCKCQVEFPGADAVDEKFVHEQECPACYSQHDSAGSRDRTQPLPA